MATETGEVFLMTDKKKTKDCKCTYTGCFNICRVNTFYAPARAKCPKHGGQAFIRKSTEGMDFEELTPELVDTVEIEINPNYKIRSLMCPICDTDEPLEILACTEWGFIDFGCQGCQTIVSIAFNFKSAQKRSIPKNLIEVVKKFNVQQVGSMDPSVLRKMSGFSLNRN